MKLRMILFFVTSLILSIVLVGGLNEVGQVIKYPATAKMSVTRYTGKDKKATITEIDQLAKKANLTIYRPFVTDSGTAEVAQLGVNPTHLSDLLSRSVTGDYFLSHTSKNFQNTMAADRSLVADFISLNLFIFPLVELTQSVSAPSLWVLFLIFFISVYSIEVSQSKKAMIYRSLGKFGSYAWKNLFYSWLVIILSNLVILIGFAISQGSIESLYFKGFVLTQGIFSLILMVLVLFANLVFMSVIKFNKMSSILKQRYINRLGSMIYLVGLILAVLVFSKTLDTSLRTASRLSSYESSISMWQSVNNYVKPNFDYGMETHTTSHTIDGNYMVNQTNRELQFDQSIPDKDFIFVASSKFDSQMEKFYSNLGSTKGGSKFVALKTDSNLSSDTYYVSRGVILLNQKLNPKNTFGTTDADKLITLYAPKSFEGKVQKIENNVIAENFALLSNPPDASQFQVNFVPDDQEMFLLNFNPLKTPYMTNALPKQTAKKKIFVQFNYQKLSAYSNDILRVANNNTIPYDAALIQRDTLVKQLKASGLSDQLTSVDNISADVAQLAQTVRSQLFGTILVVVAIVLSSIFILWEYLKGEYQRLSKRLVVEHLFTGTSSRLEFSLFIPLLCGVSLAAVLASFATGNLLVLGLVLGLNLLEILVVMVINRRQLKENRLKIIKDSLE